MSLAVGPSVGVIKRIVVAAPIALVAIGTIASACARHVTQVNDVIIPGCDTIPEARHGPSTRVPEATPRSATGTLVGTVDERLTGTALADVLIRVRGIDSSVAQTDSTGGFVVRDLSPGRYVVAAIHLGYDAQRDTIELAAGAVVTRHYHLKYDVCP